MTATRNRGAPPSPTLTPAELLSQSAIWQGATLNDVTSASQAYVNGVAAMHQEIANFLQTRLQHDMALGESLARCRTLADATKAQSDWLKQTTDDYTAETQRLFELGLGLMRGSWTPMEESGTAPRAEPSRASASRPK